MMLVGLLGHGVVGSGVRKIIDEAQTPDTACLCVKRILVKDEAEMVESRMTQNIDDILNDSEIEIVVECMGGKEPAHTFVKKAIEAGKHVVTSNKKMLAAFADELFPLAREHGVRLMYEASVGGGIPWIAELGRIRRIDDVDMFEGIFNGTTNYILSRMDQENQEFDEMLAQARKLGYAEADPTDDIDGYDVRYKTALSCMAAFDLHVVPETIPVYGIRHILKKDMEYAHKHGCAIRLLGRGSHKDGVLQCSVMPAFVPTGGTYAGVPLNYNAITSVSRTLGTAVFTGQGAGSLPTAHAVVQDMIDIAMKNPYAQRGLKEAVPDLSGQVVCYIRNGNVKKEYVGEIIDSDTVITVPLSYGQLGAIVKESPEAMVIEVEKK
ncbi:MAG: homoserine dehydrogenase [Bulleidia sp.]